MSDLSSIIEIEQLKADIERLKAIYDHDLAASRRLWRLEEN
jgi:hypothetical protein